MNIAKFLGTSNLKKICEQLLLTLFPAAIIAEFHVQALLHATTASNTASTCYLHTIYLWEQ